MVKTGYEAVTIDEIRGVLRDTHGIEDEEFLSSTKKVLVAKLLELTAEGEVDAVLDAVEENSDDDAMQPYTEEEVSSAMPAYGSEAWHEYVMLQFRDDELVDSAPTCDGCRRVVEQVLGVITSSTLPYISPPNTGNNGTSTISVRIELRVTNEDHPACNSTIVCEEIADVNKDNCDHPYYKYASATAASRAEGRALRKLLRLRNVTTAEEVSENAETTDNDCDWQVDEPITDAQVGVMDMMCQRTDIDVMDFINSGRRSYAEIEMVTKSTAQRMIQELNKIQRQVKEKPETVKPYNAGWRQPKKEESE